MRNIISSVRFSGKKKCLIGFFIFFHWLFVLISITPIYSRKTARYNGSAGSFSARGEAPQCILGLVPYVYLLVTFQRQQWSVFAPNIPAFNFHVTAEVFFSDQSKTEFKIPCPSDLGLIGWSRVRWIDYQGCLINDQNKALRPAFVRYVLRNLAKDGRTPIRVGLFVKEANIPRPGSEEVGKTCDFSSLIHDQGRYKSRMLLSYAVSPADFK